MLSCWGILGFIRWCGGIVIRFWFCGIVIKFWFGGRRYVFWGFGIVIIVEDKVWYFGEVLLIEYIGVWILFVIIVGCGEVNIGFGDIIGSCWFIGKMVFWDGIMIGVIGVGLEGSRVFIVWRFGGEWDIIVFWEGRIIFGDCIIVDGEIVFVVVNKLFVVIVIWEDILKFWGSIEFEEEGVKFVCIVEIFGCDCVWVKCEFVDIEFSIDVVDWLVKDWSGDDFDIGVMFMLFLDLFRVLVVFLWVLMIFWIFWGVIFEGRLIFIIEFFFFDEFEFWFFLFFVFVIYMVLFVFFFIFFFRKVFIFLIVVFVFILVREERLIFLLVILFWSFKSWIGVSCCIAGLFIILFINKFVEELFFILDLEFLFCLVFKGFDLDVVFLLVFILIVLLLFFLFLDFGFLSKDKFLEFFWEVSILLFKLYWIL